MARIAKARTQLKGSNKRSIITATSVVACVALIAGCSSGGDAASSESSRTQSGSGGELVSSGFGQSGEYVWVTSLVKNTSGTVGQTVTVQFNVLDDKGSIIASTDQVEAFSTPDQTLAVGTQVTLPKNEKAAKVNATLDIKEDGIGPKEPKPTMPPIKAQIKPVQYGDGFEAIYDVANPTSEPLKDVRIGVVCTNSSGKIIGGAVEFPNLIPASGKVQAKNTVITSGKPAECTAYPSIAGF